MGGSFDYRTYDYDDREKITKHFQGECEQAKYDDGSSYPGTIAAMRTVNDWRDKRFSTRAEAELFMTDEHNKWDEAMAVSYFLPHAPTARDKARAEKAKVKWDVAQANLNKANAKVRADFANAKTKTVGCKGCGSKLSRAHLAKKLQRSAIICPLCNGDLLSATVRTRLTKINDAVHNARHAFEDAQKPKASKKVGWIVGGWCSS